jgi:predicted transcriptional regulator
MGRHYQHPIGAVLTFVKANAIARFRIKNNLETFKLIAARMVLRLIMKSKNSENYYQN